MTINNTNLTTTTTTTTPVELSFDWEYDGMEHVSWTSHTTSIEGKALVLILVFDHSTQEFSVSASCRGILVEVDHKNLGVAVGKAVTSMVYALDLHETLEEYETDMEYESMQEWKGIAEEYGGYCQPAVMDGGDDFTYDPESWDDIPF